MSFGTEAVDSPHLVMAVGNHVVGDSRVEKAAMSARDLGYKVTVLGIKHRSVNPVGFIDGDIPVLRLPLLNLNHRQGLEEAVKRFNNISSRDWRSKHLERAEKNEALAAKALSRSRQGERSAAMRVRDLAAKSVLIASELAMKASERLSDFERAAAQQLLSGVSVMPEGWRRLWPQISDYQAVFEMGFEFLAPDLIHVHDRHPMPGAASYCRKASERGIEVKWAYDAHEWLPGQVFSAPLSHRVGWLEAERDLIRDASSVITVSERMAAQLQDRHSLKQEPKVVVNAPLLNPPKDENEPRMSIRADLGLDEHSVIAVYVGAIAERRGVLVMVEAISQLYNVHAVFLAPPDPRSRKAIRDKAAECGVSDRVHILDYVSASHVSTYVSSADVGVSPLLPTPAHHQAAPTKIREYVHARLPIVATNMKVQGEFVEESKIGEVVKAGDAKALAGGIQTVLDDFSAYQQRFTDEFIRRNSWEGSAPILGKVWADLHPAAVRMEQPKNRKRMQRLVAIDSKKDGLLSRYLDGRHTRKSVGLVTVLPRPVNVDNFLGTDGEPLGNDAAEAWSVWQSDYSNLVAVVSDSLELNSSASGAPSGKDASISGVTRTRYVGSRDIDDVAFLLDTYPHHWLHELDVDAINRRERQARRARERIIGSGEQIVSPFVLTAQSFQSACKLVLPPLHLRVEYEECGLSRTGKLRVGVLDVPRSKRENAAIAQLRTVNTRLQLFDLASANANFGGCDVVVDSLSEDHASIGGMRAMAAGSVVIVGRSTRESRAFAPEAPTIATSIGQLTTTINHFAADVELFEQARKQSFQYATDRFSFENSLSNLIKAVKNGQH